MARRQSSIISLLIPVAIPFVFATLLMGQIDSEDTEDAIRMEEGRLSAVESTDPPLRGSVLTPNGRHHYSDVRLASFTQGESTREGANGVRIISTDGGNALTMTAMGRDWIHHPANAYLTGSIPFEADSLWVPMQTIAQRLKYVLDDRHFGGLEEIWQTTGEAYARMRGDCEDHAILLADWLIHMGYDARVAVGTYKGGGHAWVVLFHKGSTYLLEATDKRKRRRYPLAAYHPEYRPQYLFNRDTFWQNTGNDRTTDYAGKRWRIISRFQAQNL